MLLARQVRRKRHGHGIDGARALQQARRDREPDIVRHDAEEAAGGKDQEPRIDEGLSAPAVGGHAVRNLQHALREAVAANRDAHEREIRAAAQRGCVHREHRQDEKEPEHAQPVDAGEACAGAQFGGAHAIGGQRQDAAGKRDAL